MQKIKAEYNHCYAKIYFMGFFKLSIYISAPNINLCDKIFLRTVSFV